MLNAQQLMNRVRDFDTKVAALKTSIGVVVTGITNVEKDAIDLKTELGEWQQGIDQVLLHNRKMAGAAVNRGAGAVATNGKDTPVSEFVLAYLRENPWAAAGDIMGFLQRQQRLISKSTLQYNLTKLRESRLIRTKGPTNHRTYAAKEARA